MAKSDRIEKLTVKAKGGDARAQQDLGNEYCWGKLVPASPETAALWWTRAAENGNIDAMQSLADAYKNGLGVTADFATAARWFARASSGKHDEAFYLAWMEKQAGKTKAAGKPAAMTMNDERGMIVAAAAERGLGRVARKIATAMQESVKLVAAPTPDKELAVGASKLGGLPDLPAEPRGRAAPRARSPSSLRSRSKTSLRTIWTGAFPRRDDCTSSATRPRRVRAGMSSSTTLHRAGPSRALRGRRISRRSTSLISRRSHRAG